MSREHELKCWPEPYDATAAGIKPFEFRRDDRGFAVGDILILRKWDPSAGVLGYYFEDKGAPIDQRYPKQRVRVTYLTRCSQWGGPADFVVMGIEPEAHP